MIDEGKPLKLSIEASSCLKFSNSWESSLPCWMTCAGSKSPRSLNTTSLAVGYLPPLEMITVSLAMFGLLNGDQPGGVGIDTVRSGRDPGATCWPVTPMPSRYCDRGTGFPVVVVVVVVVDFVDKID